MDERLKEIHLLLVYLSGWYENSPKVPGKKIFIAWKGYLFRVLNELERDRLIRQFRNSLILTEDGLKKAESIKERYL
jgi:hypothetical protein